MTTIVYQGYVARLDIDLEAGVIHGEVLNTRDVLTFSVENAKEAEAEFAATIEDYRKWCEAEGVAPEKPYSGTLTLRVPVETHRLAAVRAAEEKISLTAWISRLIECQLGQRPANLTQADVDRQMRATLNDEIVRVLVRRESETGTMGVGDWESISSTRLETRSIQ